MLTIGLNKLCIQGNYCPHRRGLTLYLDKSKKYRKSLWTEKQKRVSFLSLFCHHRYIVDLMVKYYMLWGYLYKVFTTKNPTNIEAFQKLVFIYVQSQTISCVL